MSLVIEDLSASYGNIQVIWNVSLKIEKGEIVSLVGSNGAGKSTLLRCIMGIVKPTQGRITFENNALLATRTHSRVRHGISYVPEGRRLFPAMTVEDNLILGSPSRAPDISSRIDQVFRLFPVLKERRSQFAGNLSGGEQQMLAIGRALMAKPKLMLLDELSAGLAPVMFDRVLDSIQSINEIGVSILLAEQNAERALEVSKRSYVLENGRIALEGTSEKLSDDPRIRRAYLGMGEVLT
ncbi:MAG: ABC transporter ATP-binding protein [Nitrososphaerota archaeon]|nr:ABC transporter ATP-binding protein [Nitrososphaerota archaeon]